jgi:nucleoside-diphosphate-sugar epimerase
MLDAVFHDEGAISVSSVVLGSGSSFLDVGESSVSSVVLGSFSNQSAGPNPSDGPGPTTSARSSASESDNDPTLTDDPEWPVLNANTKTVVITGVSGALGRRVVAALAKTSDWNVVGIDTAWFPSGVPKPRRFTVHRLDLRTTELASLLHGADCLVHLAADDPALLDAATSDRPESRVTSRVLSAAALAGVRQLVFISSAVVYGAWADNPVPLTEDAPLRPTPGFTYSDAKLELERAVTVWHRERPETSVAVLRPAVTLGHPESRSWLAKTVQPSLVDRLGHGLPVLQYVHVDDVASAVVHTLRHQLDGTFNVSSDDWLQSEQAHELLGPNLRLPIPSWLTNLLRTLIDQWPGKKRPEGAQSFSQYPWVVANDRLRRTGWSPRSSSAEAFVANRRPSRLTKYVARHRQEVTLVAVGSVALAVVSVLVGLFVRARNRRS